MKEETPVAMLTVGQLADYLTNRFSDEKSKIEGYKVFNILRNYPWTDEGASYKELNEWFQPELHGRLSDIITAGFAYNVIYKSEDGKFHINTSI